MKLNLKILALVMFATSMPAFAGPITGGGPRMSLYRAVCFIRTNPQELAPYEIMVGFTNHDSSLHDVKIYADPDSNPRVIEELSVRQNLTQRRGSNETYVAEKFYLDIQTDQCSPNGGKTCGTFAGVIAGEEVKGTAQCQLFNQN